MLINRTALDSMYTQFVFIFDKAYQDAPVIWDKIATRQDSKSRQNTYGWMGKLPRMREWLGERRVNNMAQRAYTLRNKKWEDTIGVYREDIEDDQLGGYRDVLATLGQVAKQQPDLLLAEVIEAGTTALGYDGQPFFHNSHPNDIDNSGAGTYQNNFANSGTGGSAAFPLNATNYALAAGTMGTWKGEDGRPLGVMPTHLMVPPALKYMARTLLNAEFTAFTPAFGPNASGGVQSNILKGDVELIVNPYLTQADAWYLLVLDKPIKPFIFQEREAPKLQQKTNEDDDNVFFRDEYLYGARARNNAGYALPFLALRGSATT